MKNPIQKVLHRKAPSPATRFLEPFNERPYPSVAALAALVTGMAFCVADKNLHRPRSTEKGASAEVTPAEPSYFEAAPRSISGSHSQLTDSGSRRLSKTGGSLLLGSAAALSTIYFFGRKK